MHNKCILGDFQGGFEKMSCVQKIVRKNYGDDGQNVYSVIHASDALFYKTVGGVQKSGPILIFISMKFKFHVSNVNFEPGFVHFWVYC